MSRLGLNSSFEVISSPAFVGLGLAFFLLLGTTLFMSPGLNPAWQRTVTTFPHWATSSPSTPFACLSEQLLAPMHDPWPYPSILNSLILPIKKKKETKANIEQTSVWPPSIAAAPHQLSSSQSSSSPNVLLCPTPPSSWRFRWFGSLHLVSAKKEKNAKYIWRIWKTIKSYW